MSAVYRFPIRRARVLIAAQCVAWLLVALTAYLHNDYRNDQRLTLARGLNITTVEDLREELKQGDICRDDFPWALFIAINVNLPSGVQNLLTLGVDLHARDERGRTPLQAAR